MPTRGGAPWRSTDSTPGKAIGSIGSTSSSWSSSPVSGTRIPSCASVGVQHLLGQPGVGRRGERQLVGQVVHAGHAEVGAEGGGELGGDHPVGPGEAGRRELGAEAAHPALDVGRGARPLVRHRARQDDVGVRVDRLGRVARHGDDEVPGRERLLGHGAVGEVVERVGAEQHEGAHAGGAGVALARHGGEDVGRREPGARRGPSPRPR